MRSFRIAIFGLIILFFISMPYTIFAEDISFSIDDVSIEATIEDNGDMHVTETFEYDIDYFNGMLRTINGVKNKDINNFSAHEVSPNFKELRVETIPNSKGIEYRIHRQTENEIVTFELNYTIKNGVTKYQDVSEFYWKFFDQTNTSSFGNLSVRIRFPQKVDKENAMIYAHDNLNSTIHFQDDGSVLYNVGRLPSGQMTEVRILFPNEFVPNATNIKNTPIKNDVVKEEAKWANKTKTKFIFSIVSGIVLFFIGMGNIFLILYMYRRFGKEEEVQKYTYYRELPSNFSPAIVSYLMEKSVAPKDISATFLDLVRKKVLTFEKTIKPQSKLPTFFQNLIKKENYKFTLVGSTTHLSEQENYLIDLFFYKIGNGKSITTYEIETYSKGAPVSFREQFKSWSKLVEKEGKKYGFFEEQQEKKLSFTFIGFIGIIVGIASVFIAPIGLFSMFIISTSIAVIFYSSIAQKRTLKGAIEYEKWKGFKHYLTEFGKLNEKPAESIVIWEYYLVFAISFGIAELVLKQLQIYLPDMHDISHGTYLTSQSFASSNSFDTGAFSSFTNSMTSAFTYSEPSSGSGGGSSSGGGGGGGGGGAGGF